jgi:hypothetical protein
MLGGVNYLCAFNGSAVSAVESGGVLTCTTPPATYSSGTFEPASVLAAVTINGADYSTDALAFVYHDIPVVSSIYPQSGSARGGAIITVSGSRLQAGSQPRCRYGVAGTVSGSMLSSQSMLCHTPAAAPLRDLMLEVSLNAQQYTNDGTVYSVYAHPAVSAFSPDRGPVDGGTRVRIYGTNFDGGTAGTYECKIGEERQTATLVNRSLLECTSMALVEGVHSSR